MWTVVWALWHRTSIIIARIITLSMRSKSLGHSVNNRTDATSAAAAATSQTRYDLDEHDDLDMITVGEVMLVRKEPACALPAWHHAITYGEELHRSGERRREEPHAACHKHRNSLSVSMHVQQSPVRIGLCNYFCPTGSNDNSISSGSS